MDGHWEVDHFCYKCPGCRKEAPRHTPMQCPKNDRPYSRIIEYEDDTIDYDDDWIPEAAANQE